MGNLSTVWRFPTHHSSSALLRVSSLTLELQVAARSTVTYRDRVMMATMGPVARRTACSLPTTLATSFTLTCLCTSSCLHKATMEVTLSAGMLKVRSLNTLHTTNDPLIPGIHYQAQVPTDLRGLARPFRRFVQPAPSAKSVEHSLLPLQTALQRSRHSEVVICTTLHSTAQHRTALHSTALHCTALHCTATYVD